MPPMSDSMAQPVLDELAAIYTDLHCHPELSMHEVRTAKIVGDYVQALGYEVTRAVGVTGVVAVLRNGAGPTVMLRADMEPLADVRPRHPSHAGDRPAGHAPRRPSHGWAPCIPLARRTPMIDSHLAPYAALLLRLALPRCSSRTPC